MILCPHFVSTISTLWRTLEVILYSEMKIKQAQKKIKNIFSESLILKGLLYYCFQSNRRIKKISFHIFMYIYIYVLFYDMLVFLDLCEYSLRNNKNFLMTLQAMTLDISNIKTDYSKEYKLKLFLCICRHKGKSF